LKNHQKEHSNYYGELVRAEIRSFPVQMDYILFVSGLSFIVFAWACRKLVNDRLPAWGWLAVMDDYLAKPVSSEHLASAIGKLLDDQPDAGRAAPGGPAAQAVVFDRPALLARVLHDEAILRTLVETFLEDFPGRMVLLRNSVDRCDAQAAANQAHAVKGAAANMGGMALSEAAARMEQAGKAGRTQELAGLLQQLERQFEILKNEMNGA
jgi:two-component system, sensor histidine kinase and response regulator